MKDKLRKLTKYDVKFDNLFADEDDAVFSYLSLEYRYLRLVEKCERLERELAQVSGGK